MQEDFTDLLGEDAAPAESVEEFAQPIEDAQESTLPDGANSKTVARFKDEKALVQFMNKMRKIPLDQIDDVIVTSGYAAAVWMFRAAAMRGDIQAAKSLDLWLKWATPIVKKPKRGDVRVIKNNAAKQFLPREVE